MSGGAAGRTAGTPKRYWWPSWIFEGVGNKDRHRWRSRLQGWAPLASYGSFQAQNGTELAAQGGPSGSMVTRPSGPWSRRHEIRSRPADAAPPALQVPPVALAENVPGTPGRFPYATLVASAGVISKPQGCNPHRRLSEPSPEAASVRPDAARRAGGISGAAPCLSGGPASAPPRRTECTRGLLLPEGRPHAPTRRAIAGRWSGTSPGARTAKRSAPREASNGGIPRGGPPCVSCV